jgi:hypothetical protein
LPSVEQNVNCPRTKRFYMHTLPSLTNPQFTALKDGGVAVDGTDYTIELGHSRWRICLAGKGVIFGFRTLSDAKAAFAAKRPAIAAA